MTEYFLISYRFAFELTRDTGDDKGSTVAIHSVWTSEENAKTQLAAMGKSKKWAKSIHGNDVLVSDIKIRKSFRFSQWWPEIITWSMVFGQRPPWLQGFLNPLDAQQAKAREQYMAQHPSNGDNDANE